MKEIKRFRKGIKYQRSSINNHSVRVYEHAGKVYYLDRLLLPDAPCFSLYTFPNTVIAHYERLDGLEYWGDGISWNKAIEKVEQFLSKKSETC